MELFTKNYRLLRVMHYLTKTMKLVLLTVMLAFTISFLSPQSAYSHAQLTDSSPKADEKLSASPSAVTLTFSVPVEAADDSIGLYDNAGNIISSDSSTKSIAPDKVELKLKKLDPSIYIVKWNVVSGDSHPISGTFTFTVGEPAVEKSTVETSVFQDIALQDDTNSYGFQANFVRWILFISSAIVVAFFLLNGLSILKTSPKLLRKLVFIPVIISICVSIASVFIQNAVVENTSIISSISISSIADQLQYKFGLSALVRILALLALLLATLNAKAIKFLTPLFCMIVVATITFSGHSSSGDLTFLSIPLSLIHVAATSIWFGGLFAALLSFKIKNIDFDLHKFSKIAFACVLAMLASGFFATWRQVGGLKYGRNSDFGQTLGLKIGLVIAIIAIAFFTRKYLKNSQTTKMSKFIALELVLMLGVFGLTSVLVSQIPSKTSAEIPVTMKSMTNNGILEVSADPAKAGNTQLHIYVYDHKGIPLQIETNKLGEPPIKVTIQNEEQDIEPIDVAMRFQGLNHFNSVSLHVPFAGKWKVDVQIQVNESDQIADQIEFEYL